MSLAARKPVFGVSDLKRVSNQSPQLQRLARKPVLSLHIMLSETRITKALISLRGCAGWPAPMLFAPPPPHEDRFFSR